MMLVIMIDADGDGREPWTRLSKLSRRRTEFEAK